MRAIAWILGLAVLWGVTGAFAGWGLQIYVDVEGWVLSCGLLNVVIGLVLLQLVTQSEQARDFFYEGKKPHEDYFNPGLVLLWALPFLLAFLGFLWWVTSKFYPL